jgi:ferric-dicitrate binding protein FerR (iron transport regulator)
MTGFVGGPPGWQQAQQQQFTQQQQHAARLHQQQLDQQLRLQHQLQDDQFHRVMRGRPPASRHLWLSFVVFLVACAGMFVLASTQIR